MNRLILNILPHSHHHHLTLLLAHAQNPRHDRHRDGRQALQRIMRHPHAHRFLLLPFRPRIHRPHKPPLHHILEAHVSKPFRIFSRTVPISAHLAGAFEDQIVPFARVRVEMSAVDGESVKDDVLHFEIPARRECLICSPENCTRIAETREEHAAVNEVEWLSVHPGVLRVVYLEPTIWWDAVAFSYLFEIEQG